MIRLERFIVKAKLILNSFLCFFVVTNLLNAKAPYSIVGEMEINQKVMVDVMKVLTVITTQEKTKEIETEEIEAEFSLG